jgi:hypothetical protein
MGPLFAQATTARNQGSDTHQTTGWSQTPAIIIPCMLVYLSIMIMGLEAAVSRAWCTTDLGLPWWRPSQAESSPHRPPK